MQRVSRGRGKCRSACGTSRSVCRAVALAFAASIVVVAYGKAVPQGRRTLTQQPPTRASEVYLTKENITEIEQVIQNLTDGSALILALNQIQLDDALVLTASVTVRGMSSESRPVITCGERNFSAFRIEADGVLLQDLAIQGCGSPGVRLQRSGPIDSQPWKSTFRRVRFEGNGDIMDFGTFLPSGATLIGGGLGCGDGFDLTVDDCYFRSNVAVAGAGIYVDGSSLVVVNTTFEDNVADGAEFSQGGAITVTNTLSRRLTDLVLAAENCTFLGNKDLSGDLNKNALRLSTGSPLERSQYVSFPTPQPSGGAIFARNIRTVNVVNSDFLENFAIPAGGALFFTSVQTTRIRDCTFFKNAARLPNERTKGCSQGGALYAELLGDAPSLTVTSGAFDDNEAMCGGAVHLVGAVEALVEFERSVFNGNKAQSGGGALIRNIFSPRFIRTSFNSNVASTGGGILLTNDAGIVATTSQPSDPAATFEGNAAVEGGAIAMIGGGVVNLESIPFVNNHALHYGGAMALIEGSVSSSVVIENAEMENNTAARGGAVFMENVYNVDIRPSNRIKKYKFRRNVARQGGAIYFRSESKTVSNVRVFGVEFIENMAVNSFADALEDLSPATSFFQNPDVANFTEFTALAKVIEDRMDLIDRLRRSLLTGGEVFDATGEENMEGSGGGVLLALGNIPARGSVTVTLESVSFRRNVARNGGGLAAIMSDGQWEERCNDGQDLLFRRRGNVCRSISLTGVKFANNGAQMLGGAVAATHPQHIYVRDYRSAASLKLSDAGFPGASFVNNMVDVGGAGNDVGTMQ